MGRVDVELPWPQRFERNVRIVEAFAEGRTLREIAEEVGTPLSNVSVILRQAGVYPAVGRRSKALGRRSKALERRRSGARTLREKAIARARELGETLASIGARYGVSRQRIQQIIASMPPGEEGTTDMSDCMCTFDGCSGLGIAHCSPPCGGDQCICVCGGEQECHGCDFCDPLDDYPGGNPGPEDDGG